MPVRSVKGRDSWVCVEDMYMGLKVKGPHWCFNLDPILQFALKKKNLNPEPCMSRLNLY